MGLDGVHVIDGNDEVRVGWDGVHVKDGKEQVSVGWTGVHRSQPGGQPPSSSAGDHKYFRTGMFMILAGAVLGIFLGCEHLREFYAGPSLHFSVHRNVDLAMFASFVVVAGGIALAVAGCCLPVVILSAIAAILPIPWLWSDHTVLSVIYIIYSLWLMSEVCKFGVCARPHGFAALA